jgi:hypothetical protein
MNTSLPHGHIRFLLPTGIDPSDPTWGYGERPAKIAYVAHHVSTQPYDDWRDYVSVHSPSMKQVISSETWQKARTILEPYWQINNSYQTGIYPKGYRWKARWQNVECVEHIVHCPRLKRLIAQLRQTRISKMTPLERGVYQDLLAIRCPIADIDGFLLELPDRPGTKCESRRRAVYRASIHQIREGAYTLSERGRTGRMYHSLTRTPRAVRATLTIAGEKAVEVDLANSQPYFMASLFLGQPDLAEAVSNGSFYERINTCMERPWDCTNPEQRTELKKTCLTVIYSKPCDRAKWSSGPNSKPLRIETAMEKAFPGLPLWISEYARIYGPTALAIRMQRLESQVFIDCVLPQLQQFGIPVVPIHDSFLCRESDAGAVEAHLERALFEGTRLRPKIKKQTT